MGASGVASRLDEVQRQMASAAARSGRKLSDIQLVAVSKRQPLELMREYCDAAAALGIAPLFGENYVQELKKKRAGLGKEASFHVTGPLQGNKVRDAVKLADVIESVHSPEVLEAIAAEARRAGKRQPVLLQVNIAADGAKQGFAPSDVEGIVRQAALLGDAIRLDGLMTITALYDQPEGARADFRRMSALRTSLEASGCGALFHGSRILLSMGMSADYAVAIEEGADIVRIGTAIFGEREG